MEHMRVEPAFVLMAMASSAHLIEEYVYPGGFLRWMRSVSPLGAPGPVAAVLLNAAFFAYVLWPLIFDPRAQPVFSLAVAGLLLTNGATHIAGTLLTHSYSPGVVTSVVGYLPSAICALVTLTLHWHLGIRQIALSLLLGVAWQLLPLAWLILRRLFHAPQPR